MKKIISLLLAVVMTMSFFTIVPISTNAEEVFKSGDFEYVLLEDGTAEITFYTGTETDVSFPSSLDGYTVTSIAANAFDYYDNHEPIKVSNITIPDTIVSIGEYAFYENYLVDVILPESISYVGEGAFYMSSLKSLTIENPNCKFDSTVTYSTKIYGYSNSTAQTYAEKYNMKFIPLDCEVPEFEYIVLEDGTARITEYNGESTEVVIPQEIDGYKVTVIGGYSNNIGYPAFENNEDITKVTIPQGVTTLGHSAFVNCSNLESVILPEGLESIEACVFMDCDKLANITIPNGVAEIGWNAFYSCDSLSNLVIPSSVEAIGSSAFEYCSGLTSVVVSEGVTIIGVSAFENCTNLTDVVLPQSLTRLDKRAFCGCSNLKNVSIPSNLTQISERCFRDCTSFMSITIPENITNIQDCAFDGCEDLLRCYILNPECKIDSDGWDDETISGDYITIYGYSNSTAQTYANNEHKRFISLDDLHSSNDFEYRILDDNTAEIMSYIGDNASISVPSSIDGYAVSKIGDYAMTNPNLTEIVIPDSVSIIGEYTFSDTDYYSDKSKNLTSIAIPDTVTSIGKYAFYGCDNLTEISIPSSITDIEESTFEGCKGLAEIYIPDSVTNIGDSAFRNCESVTKIHIPNSVENLGASAFSSCTNLTEIIIPDSIANIENYCFSYCNNLTQIAIPNSVTNIGNMSFYGCINLKEIVFPNSEIHIGEEAFLSCDKLTEVTIPATVTQIGEDAFGYYYDSYRDSNKPIKNFKIYGYENTAAQKYAEENGFEFISLDNIPQEPTEIIDGATNVSVTTQDKVNLNVELITGDEELARTNTLLNGECVDKLFDITLIKDGEAIQPSSPVTVKIPTDNENAKVYRVEENDTLTDMNATYFDGYMVFTTEHFSKYVLAVPNTIEHLIGDVNGDGEVAVMDATIIQQHLAGIKHLSEDSLKMADVDQDGEVAVMDATKIQRFLAKLIDSL